MITEAQPKDSLQRKDLFYSDNWSFIAAALVTNPLIVIKEIVPHPVKPNQRLFYLSPFSACEKLWQDFRNNQLSVDAKTLAIKINEVRLMPLTEQVQEKSGEVSFNPYWSPRQVEAWKNPRTILNGEEEMRKMENSQNNNSIREEGSNKE